MSFGGLYYPAYTPGFGSKPRLQTVHPFRNLLAAGSHLNNQWSGVSGHPDYGLDATDYDYHSGPSVHVPSGGSYSYHATAGSGYGPPAAAPAVHPPAKPIIHSPTGGKKGFFGGGGKHGSSAMSALTLLSFLFFINLLQGCIKDHMDAINPTVMVMTTNVIRNRFNKMGEINSREQSSSYTSNAANILVQPHDLIQAAAAQSSSAVEATRTSVNLQSTYSNKPISLNRPLETALPQPSAPYMSNSPEPEIAISYEYAKPLYDPHKPDAHVEMTQQQHTLPYDNQTIMVAQSPPYKFTPVEQHYSFHHTEYNAQSAPPQAQASPVAPLQSTSSKPFYENQYPLAVKPLNGAYGAQYGGGPQQDYDFRQKYETTQQLTNSPFSQFSTKNSAQPWSTNLHTPSVTPGPYRRASIIAVSPKTKWIAVPAKIIDRSNFEDGEEHFEHHDDRDAFHSRLN